MNKIIGNGSPLKLIVDKDVIQVLEARFGLRGVAAGAAMILTDAVLHDTLQPVGPSPAERGGVNEARSSLLPELPL